MFYTFAYVYTPNFGLVEAAEADQRTVHVMSQEGLEFLRRAALAEEVGENVICDPHPSVVERTTIPEGEGIICINGLVSGTRGATSDAPASRVMRTAMAEAEAAGYELIDPEWYEKMARPESGLRMSAVGVNPMGHGWSGSSQYPKNYEVQRRAASGLVRFMGTRDVEDLFEVEDSLMSDGGKPWSWQMSVPMVVWDGVRARKYLRDNPDDVKGAFHTTAQVLFQPWNR